MKGKRSDLGDETKASLWAEAVEAEESRDRAVNKLEETLRKDVPKTTRETPLPLESQDKATETVHGHQVPGSTIKYDNGKQAPGPGDTLPDRAFNWGATKYAVLTMAEKLCIGSNKDYRNLTQSKHLKVLRDAVLVVAEDIHDVADRFRKDNFLERNHPIAELPPRGGVEEVPVADAGQVVATMHITPKDIVNVATSMANNDLVKTRPMSQNM
jgi:hypothetical protein